MSSTTVAPTIAVHHIEHQAASGRFTIIPLRGTVSGCDVEFELIEPPGAGWAEIVGETMCGGGEAAALVAYRGDPGFSGSDGFTYRITDRSGSSDAEVDVIVRRPEPPRRLVATSTVVYTADGTVVDVRDPETVRIDGDPDTRWLLTFDLDTISGTVVDSRLRIRSHGTSRNPIEVLVRPATGGDVDFGDIDATSSLVTVIPSVAAGELITIPLDVALSGAIEVWIGATGPSTVRLASAESTSPPELLVEISPDGRVRPAIWPTVVEVSPRVSTVWYPEIVGGPFECHAVMVPDTITVEAAPGCRSLRLIVEPQVEGRISFPLVLWDGAEAAEVEIVVDSEFERRGRTISIDRRRLPTDRSSRLTLSVDGPSDACPARALVVSHWSRGRIDPIGDPSCVDGRLVQVIEYQPAPGFVGIDTFGVQVRDRALGWAEEVVRFVVDDPGVAEVIPPVRDVTIASDPQIPFDETARVLRLDGSPTTMALMSFDLRHSDAIGLTLWVRAEAGSTAVIEARRAVETAEGVVPGETIGSVEYDGIDGTWLRIDLDPDLAEEGRVALLLTTSSPTGIRLSSDESRFPPFVVQYRRES